MPAIALHANELDSTGVELLPIEEVKESIQTPHRDDHYVFLLQQQGRFQLELDFDEVTLKDCCMLFIAPGQVHRYIRKRDVTGWFVFLQPELLTTLYRDVFDTYQHARQLIPLQKTDPLFHTLPVVREVLREKTPFKQALVRSLSEALTGLIAARITQADGPSQPYGTRQYHIATQFKQLVKAKCKDLKQVSRYAALLHITALHLNETVKNITGFPASHWIQQEVLLEAKRLLRYTDLDIRQIADELGYEDPAYFSRFFRTHAGMTASAFRETNHGLSKQRH